MKKYGVTIVAGMAALVIAGAASAQTTNYIRITGAQADRNSLNSAIGNILSNGFVYGYAGSSLSTANQAEFRGVTLVGGYPVDIKTSLIGSTGGVQDLTQGLTLNSWFNGTNLTTSGKSGLTGPTETALADATISDSFQSETLYTSPTLVDHIVGVLPYVWVKNAGAPSTITNVTSLLAQILLGTGQIPLSQVTGLNADEGTAVTAIGRDENAGVRLVAFAETGFGIYTPPFQYQPTITGTPGTGGVVTAVAPWPVNTVNGITYPVGHSGYSTGSAEAAALNTPGSLAASGGWFIGYLAINDASTVTLGGALTYNGVAYTPTAVEEGQYTFWSYAHLMYPSSLTGTKLTIANQLVNQIHNVDGILDGPLIDSMNVGRTVEGGEVTFGNPY